jgi:hypothetical protein
LGCGFVFGELATSNLVQMMIVKTIQFGPKDSKHNPQYKQMRVRGKMRGGETFASPGGLLKTLR